MCSPSDATGAAHVADHVHIAFLDDAGDVTGFDAAVPQRRRTLLRRHGQRQGLQFLAVGAERDQRRARHLGVIVVGVGGQVHTVAHGDAQIFVDDHDR